MLSLFSPINHRIGIHPFIVSLTVAALSSSAAASNMAWRCSAETNDGLVDNLKRGELFQHPRVERAMRATDRKHYVRASCRTPYEDAPQVIGYGATISAPHMHAMALELLEDRLQVGMRSLDVGSGSGYLTAVMARMTAGDDGSSGHAYGVEHIPELVAMSQANLDADDESLRQTIVTIKQSDGRLGLAEFAPYDCIHVGAAADGIPPELLEQLRVGGKMVIPVGAEHGNQELVLIERTTDSDYKRTRITGVRYVPLTDFDHQVDHRAK